MLVVPTGTARWSPTAATSAARPTQTHEPSTKCRRSQSKTSAEAYAVPGSVRAWPIGRSTGSRRAGSIGAGSIGAAWSGGIDQLPP